MFCSTRRILDAHFFCAESQEIINLVELAMDADLYTVLLDAIYAHATMSEALNDLLQGLAAQSK